MAPLAVCLLGGYVFGACPWGLWLGLWFKGVDVRTRGSRNLGATNVYRTLGPGLGLATLVLDILKGALPVWILPAWVSPGHPYQAAVAGLGAVLGHVWSFWVGFRGGKGVATSAGALLALAPLAFAVFAVACRLTVGLTGLVWRRSPRGPLAFVAPLVVTPPDAAAGPMARLPGLLVMLIV